MNNGNKRWWVRTKRIPSRTGVPPAGRGSGVNISDLRRPTTPYNMKTYDIPLMMNSQPVPNGPTRDAASAGPKIREPVITAVFNDIALPISCGGTNSVTNPRRDGLSIAPTNPRTPVKTNTNSTLMTPATSHTPSTIACSAISDCVTIVVRRRSNLSAKAPAHAPSSNIGKN